MADRHVIYKNGVKEIAYLQGKAVSFMAKWRADLAGNSCHIHGSLWDADDRPMFSDGHGETELFRQFLAGLLGSGRRHDLLPRALHQLLQALPGRLVCADQSGLEPRQPHVRLSGAAATARRPEWSAASAGPT